MNLLSVLPLALVMIAGPQIISAIFLASSRDARRSSLAFLVGAGLAVIVALTVWYVVFHTVRGAGDGQHKNDGTRRLIDWVVLLVLLALMAMIFSRRKRTAAQVDEQVAGGQAALRLRAGRPSLRRHAQ